MKKGTLLSEILVDADSCQVKQEVYRVAKRYGLRVTLVANSQMHIPSEGWLKLVVVSDQFDAADDWIVEHIIKNDIVISGDIPLASRCLKKGARVLAPNGRVFTDNSIGNALATRDLMSHLRDIGITTGGPAPFEKRDRSRFLQSLDSIIQAIRNGK
ncbi:YaiI/YqxD family protein [Chloroflexota bacterium]